MAMKGNRLKSERAADQHVPPTLLSTSNLRNWNEPTGVALARPTELSRVNRSNERREFSDSLESTGRVDHRESKRIIARKANCFVFAYIALRLRTLTRIRTRIQSLPIPQRQIEDKFVIHWLVAALDFKFSIRRSFPKFVRFVFAARFTATRCRANTYGAL